jgi:dienelactone hydrolase
MRERAIVFGSHGGLVGVVTEPNAGAAEAGPRRAVIVANVGLHHHAGPFRLYVELARRLASYGWHTLRFDLAGLGDSQARPGQLGDAAQAAIDVTEAMDWLESHLQISRFVLIGLCSGTDSAHTVTLADARVAGAVFIDGYTYATFGYHLRRHTVRYLQGKRWMRYAARRVRSLASQARLGGTDSAPVPDVFAREYPPRSRFRSDVARMTERGTRLLFVYTGSFDCYYNGRTQLFETLGSGVARDRIDVHMLRGADHVFTSASQRAGLLDRIAGWLETVDA